MGLASISWNSVRVFSKVCTGLFRVLHHRTRFGTAGVSVMHILLWARPVLELPSHQRPVPLVPLLRARECKADRAPAPLSASVSDSASKPALPAITRALD